MKPDLLPCPFCGAKPIDTDVGSYFVTCPSCGIEGPYGNENGQREAAIAAWNSRAPLEQRPQPAAAPTEAVTLWYIPDDNGLPIRATGYGDEAKQWASKGHRVISITGAAPAEAAPDDVVRDAQRYRWLRHGDNDELVIQHGPIAPDYHWLPRNDRLDAMIDDHIAAQKGGKK